MSKIELEKRHGTPDEFEASCWKAFNQGFIELNELKAAVLEYKKEWDAAE